MFMPGEMPEGLTPVQQILFEVAIDHFYDGPHYNPYCVHCRTTSAKHDDDCVTQRARNELGSIWTDAVSAAERAYEEAQAAKSRAEAKEAAKKEATKAKVLAAQVACEFCGDKMHENALLNHQMHSSKCKRAQAQSGQAAIPY